MGRYSIGRFSGLASRGLVNQPDQTLPGPSDVGLRTGREAWAGNKFMGFLDWLNGFSRIGTQVVGGIDQGIDTGEWDFDLNWWQYTDEKDPHAALGSGAAIATNAAQGAFIGGSLGSIIPVVGTAAGAIVGGAAGAGIGLWETMNLDLIPDTPEQAAEQLRAKAERIQATTDNPFISKAAEALPWLAGLWNEHTLAEMAFDPLAAVSDLGPAMRQTQVGMHIAGGINRAGASVLKRVDAMPLIGPMSQWAQKTLLGIPFRRARRLAEESGQQLASQYTGYDQSVKAMANAIRKVVGDDAYLKVAPTMADITESLPKTMQIAQEVADEATKGVLKNEMVSDVLPFAQAQPIAGASERYQWLLKEAQTAMPEMPDVAHKMMAEFMQQDVSVSAMTKAWENVKGIPTSTLGDIQYVYHLLSSGTHSAQKLAVGEMTGDALEDWYRSQRSLRNVLGGEMAETLRGRNIRKPLSVINKYGAEGRAGYVKGNPELRLLEAGEAIPDNFIPIKGNVFVDDPFMINSARALRSVRAVAATDFMREFGETFGSTVAKPGWRTMKGALEGSEWDRTFGKLDKSIQDIASSTYFPDKQTVQAGLSHFQMFRNMQKRPGPIMRYLGRNKRLWGAMTLTPFTSTWNRNIFGGVMVNEQAYGAASGLMNIEAFMKLESKDPIIGEFAKLGLYDQNQAQVLFRQGEEFLKSTPLSDTPLKSFFKSLTSRKGLMPLKMGDEGTFMQRLSAVEGNDMFYGRSAYDAIDNHQRTVAALMEMSKGKSVKDAVKESMRLHFDYGDMPKWFQDTQPALAFPTWAIKMVPLQMEMLLKNPAFLAKRGRFALASQKATGMTPSETPELIKEGGGFGIPGFDVDRPMWFRPENFDPTAIFSDISDPFKFAYDMFNPFVTEPIEQAWAARKIKSGFGGPTESVRALPGTRGAENVGYDPFLDRPIVRDYAKFNEALPLVGGQPMPAFAQRADHAMRGFLRHYSEFSSGFKTYQKEYSTRGEGLMELAGRRGLGLPIFWQDMNQSIYFNLRGVDKDISAEEVRGTQRPEVLKDLYLQKLALLAHGTFAQQDPFTGDLRHWTDYGTEESEFDIKGKRVMWQEAINTCWLLLNGSTGPLNTQRIRMEIPLDDTEVDYIEGLMERLLDTYTIELGNAAIRGEAQYGRGIGYVEDRQEYMEAQ